jgi:hypothetical protein
LFPSQRRAALIALPFCWTGARAQPAGSRRLTPAQTEGPFYPVRIPPTRMPICCATAT